MKIDHLSFSQTGGAGKVAHLLSSSQSTLGHSSRLLTVLPGGLREFPTLKPSLTIASSMDEYVVKKTSSLGMISAFRRNVSSLDPSAVRQDANVHLHWMEGVLKTSEILSLLENRNRITWTVHDMAPFTGGCHQSLGCEQFIESCDRCPLVRGIFRNKIGDSFRERLPLMEFGETMTIVAPSNWMASKVKQSRIFSKCRVEIIENPIDDVFFEEQSRDSIRTKLNLSHDAIVGAFVAAQLDSPQKNTAELVEAFFKATQAISEDSFLILIGEGGQSFARMHPNVILGGPGDSEHVARLLAASDFIVSASQVESAGMFVREAGALGIPSLITSNGGSDEMIKNGESGYVFSNSSELTLGISRLCSNRSSFTKLGEKARKIAQENSQSDSVARRYLSIYE